VCTVTAAFGFGCRSTAQPLPPPPPPPPPPPNGKKVFSHYFGVGFNKKTRKWTARVNHNGKQENIGQAFATEMEAVNAVDEWLRRHDRAAEANFDESGNFVPRERTKSSDFAGVTWNKQKEQWKAFIHVNGTCEHIGYFDESEEAAAARAHDKRARAEGRPTNFDLHGQRCHAGKIVVPIPQPAPVTSLYNVPSPAAIARCFGPGSVP
jgi:hypothetical protein